MNLPDPESSQRIDGTNLRMQTPILKLVCTGDAKKGQEVVRIHELVEEMRAWLDDLVRQVYPVTDEFMEPYTVIAKPPGFLFSKTGRDTDGNGYYYEARLDVVISQLSEAEFDQRKQETKPPVRHTYR